ncbi:MAG: TIGR00730 family Rossman fold protein [Chitinophagales bacterium]|nr:TIGR00730 family Rossman fold protein [Chitinophagales bacterium]
MTDGQQNKGKGPDPRISKEESYFLEGPRSRWAEFTFIIKVMREFIRGFRKLHFIGPSVTVFGSARFKEDHPFYQLAMDVGKAIVPLGFNVMTGGGPGIMEAANRGAKAANGRSIGCNIILPHEQMPNPYLDIWVSMDLFFVRKVILTKYSYAFIVLPGGFGTLDEFFESLTLIQTDKIERFPVVIMCKEYHKYLYDHIMHMVEQGTISPEDVELFLFTDSVEEAINHIQKYAVEGFGLKKRKVFRPIPALGEKRK